MGVSESGHHVPAVRKSKGRPFEVSRSDKTRPTLFPRGENPEHNHWRLHHAERDVIGQDKVISLVRIKSYLMLTEKRIQN